MPSIRKTKKRLKRELAEAQKAFAECDCVFLADAIRKDIERIKGELYGLKVVKFISRRGKRKCLFYALANAGYLYPVMWKCEKQLNKLGKGNVLEILTGDGRSLTQSDFVVPIVEKGLRSSAPTTFFKETKN